LLLLFLLAFYFTHTRYVATATKRDDANLGDKYYALSDDANGEGRRTTRQKKSLSLSLYHKIIFPTKFSK
jgi:hypothetical protein